MSEIIQDANGDPVVVFVKFSHGLFVDAIIRAKDQATWGEPCTWLSPEEHTEQSLLQFDLFLICIFNLF